MTSDAPLAVLWDLDGTIIDTEPLWLAAEVQMLARYGLHLSDEFRESLIGSGLRTAAARFQALGVPLTVQEILDEWTRHVGSGLTAEVPAWRPGVVSLLESLRSAGIPSALVTMSLRPLAERIVGLLPTGMFQAIVTGDDVAYEKPHPDPYERGAAALGVDVRRCIAIEDSPTGARSAASAGAFVVGVPNLLDLGDAPVDRLLPSLAGVDALDLATMYRAHRTPMLAPTTANEETRS